jgi:hypothetical protein
VERSTFIDRRSVTLQTELLARRRAMTRFRRAYQARRGVWARDSNLLLVVAMLLLTAGLLVFGLTTPSFTVPPSIFAPIVVISGLFLKPSRALVVFVLAFVALTILLWTRTPATPLTIMIAMAAHLLVMAVMWWVSTARSRLGLTGIRGEQMLVDLRTSLRKGGELPELPVGWHAEAAVQNAHGDGFAGDFVLAARTGDRLELVVVDVSGKGQNAGGRSLQLSGAFGGLLGFVPPQEFLPAANDYLLRQEWPEGFATCIHVAIDLLTGSFTIASAGHPPAALHDGGSGRWSVLYGPSGPLLGIVRDAEFPRLSGVLDPGDSLLIYTDGVIETRGKDLDSGIDRMLGLADRRMRASANLTEVLCTSAPAGELDDRAAVLVARR